MKRRTLSLRLVLILSGVLAAGVTPVAQTVTPGVTALPDQLCDPGSSDCRSILLNYINNETKGIDVAFWFMEDDSYRAALRRAFVDRKVPVRVLMDTRANSTYPRNAYILDELKKACRADGTCIPMRRRLTSYILHWKMMLFHGQGIVEFSGANYSANAWRPETGTAAYTNYTDEAIYFTNDSAIFNSFATKFDDHWVNTTEWADYANVTQPLARAHPVATKDPS